MKISKNGLYLLREGDFSRENPASISYIAAAAWLSLNLIDKDEAGGE